MPGKGIVIDLEKARFERSILLTSYMNRLEDVRDECLKLLGWCHENAFQLAMAGPWKEWSDAQPEGARMELDADELHECGDPIAARLIEIGDMVWELKEMIEETVE